ncbi:MAG: DNA polymerase IV [Candidatus Aenigmatarchaeota archaeon]
MRIILHVDLDAFFAAVEEREHPEYKGLPIVVGADPKEGKGRGVVSTANYEARKYGIKSAMPISKAYKLCPNAIFLRPNFELYEKVSENIMQILRQHADKFEQVSIDEAFLDVSKRCKNFEEARQLAILIKEKIFEVEGLTCSIGIGPNKLIAKLASDYKKPDGLTVVEEEKVKGFLEPLPVEALLGIGRKTAKVLQEMKIKTVGELAKADPTLLISKFGKVGAYFYQMAHGIDESEVTEEWEPKSIGREITFEKDVDDIKFVFQVLDELIEEIYKELLKQKYFFKIVSIKIRYEDFETHTRAKTNPFSTQDVRLLRNFVYELILPFLQKEKKIRLIGARVSGLNKVEKQRKLVEVFK